jgi:nucleoside-diphosphate-sugar epimerase
LKNTSEPRVLILGGSGFVGPAIVELLLRKGARLTLLNRGTRMIEGTQLAKADRNVPEQLRAAAADIDDVSAVIDLSCYNLAQAQSAWAVFASKTHRWIHLSSAAVYAVPAGVTPVENDAVGGAPVWADYGRDKSAADQYLLSREPGLSLTILRPPYLYGPGNDNDRETFVWSRALRHRPVLVPGDGTTPIQFLHVYDLAQLCWQLISSEIEGTKVYNVAADEEVRLKNYVQKLAEICGAPDPGVLVGGFDQGFTARDYFPFRNYPCRVNATLVKDELGFKPEYAFQSGFEQTYQTYDEQWLSQRPLSTQVEDKIIERLHQAELPQSLA